MTSGRGLFIGDDVLDKAIVLIDGGYFDNLNRYLQDKRGKKISFEKLSKKVCETVGVGHYLTRFYHAYPYQDEVPTEDQKQRYRNTQRFFYSIDHIKDHQFVNVGRVRPVYFTCSKCNSNVMERKQKGVDVGTALDLVEMAKRHVADLFIFITGDEDYTKAVELARKELAKVAIFYVHDQANNIYFSEELNETANSSYCMNLDFLDQCAM